MSDPQVDPSGEFAAGWRAAIDSAGLCGAYNPRNDIPYRLCVRRNDHTGKHDDMWTPPWGDRNATAEANRRDATEHYRQIRVAGPAISS